MHAVANTNSATCHKLQAVAELKVSASLWFAGLTSLLFWVLQTTHDITNICSADFLSEVGRKTPLIARFSTVVHESGSPESLRDTRGFSVKFYTNEGNWDFVGNNMPVSSFSRACCLIHTHSICTLTLHMQLEGHNECVWRSQECAILCIQCFTMTCIISKPIVGLRSTCTYCPTPKPLGSPV